VHDRYRLVLLDATEFFSACPQATAHKELDLGAAPYERTATRRDYANGFKPKTMLTSLGELTFQVPQVRSGDFYPSALEKGTRTDQAVNLALAEMYVQGAPPAGSSAQSLLQRTGFGMLENSRGRKSAVR
jgi:hypothetical protein